MSRGSKVRLIMYFVYAKENESTSNLGFPLSQHRDNERCAGLVDCKYMPPISSSSQRNTLYDHPRLPREQAGVLSSVSSMEICNHSPPVSYNLVFPSSLSRPRRPYSLGRFLGSISMDCSSCTENLVVPMYSLPYRARLTTILSAFPTDSLFGVYQPSPRVPQADPVPWSYTQDRYIQM